jgi:hypothetical protein
MEWLVAGALLAGGVAVALEGARLLLVSSVLLSR